MTKASDFCFLERLYFVYFRDHGFFVKEEIGTVEVKQKHYSGEQSGVEKDKISKETLI